MASFRTPIRRSLQTYCVPLHKIDCRSPISIQKVSRYGNLFCDFATENIDVKRWPQIGWRPVEDGLSGGDNVTSGSFHLEWRNGEHIAQNTGVQDGSYCFAWSNQDAAARAAEEDMSAHELSMKIPYENEMSIAPNKESMHAYCFTEINYHSCGGQTFFTNDAPVGMLLALPPENRFPDNILPTDFEAFELPPGVGINIDACVWHAPPIVHPRFKKTTMQTKQAKVHSKIYYDPLKEHDTLLRINFE